MFITKTIEKFVCFNFSIIFFLTLFSTNYLQAQILPENNKWRLEMTAFDKQAGLSEYKFNEIIADFSAIFSGVAGLHDSRLVIEKYWSNSLVNLHAENFNTIWFIHVYGGYARLPNLTEDAFWLSLCHELAHHMAGFPYKSGWSTAEAQADYFATHACLQKLWVDKVEENKKYVTTVDENSKTRCLVTHTDPDQQNLCFRKATAALNLTQIFAKIQNTPNIVPGFNNFKPVAITVVEHVDAQCRFETFMRGTLCKKPYNWKKIPGKIPGSIVPVPTDPVGSNAIWAEKESAQVVCTNATVEESPGARPSCWYFDRLNRNK